jgi:hypothetical protein
MNHYEDRLIAAKSSRVELRPGQSFAVVSGVGGHEVSMWRNDFQNRPWWAVAHAWQSQLNFGALLCEYEVDPGRHKAKCEFRDINGKIWDDFELNSFLDQQ